VLCALVVALTAAACSGGAKISGTTSGNPTTPDRVRQGIAERRFIDASVLAMQQRWKEAIAAYRSALASDSGSGPVYFAIAKCFDALHQEDSALHYAQIAVRHDSDRVDAQKLVASLLMAQGRLTPAIHMYEEILRRAPEDVESRYLAAQIWQRLDPMRAVPHLEYIRHNFPEDASVLVSLGEIYVNSRRFDEAVSVFRQMLATQGGTSDIYRILGRTLLKAQRYDEALALVDEISRRLPNDPLTAEFTSDQLTRAVDALSRNVAGRAFRDYAGRLAETASRLLPRDHHVRLLVGMVRMELGDGGAADSLIVSGLADTTASSAEWATAARAYIDAGEQDKVISLLAPMHRRFGDDASVPYMIGLAYDALGRRDSAEKFARRAISVDQENDVAWDLLAGIYDRSGRFHASDDAYERAIAIAPDNPDHLNDYAYALAVRETRLDSALAMIERALEVEPDNELFLDTKGWIYFKQRNYDQALRYIRRSVDIGGADADVHRHLGDVFAALGYSVLARDEYRRASKLKLGAAHPRTRGRLSP
jgi:tetratricopeptide (TPR) repeat protein